MLAASFQRRGIERVHRFRLTSIFTHAESVDGCSRIRTAFVQERIEYAILMTRTPSQLNRRLNHWLALHRELGTVVDAHLAYRIAYQDAVALGLGVVEYEPDGPAAQEVRAATDWILNKLELV